MIRPESTSIQWLDKINLERYTTIKLGVIGNLVIVKDLEALVNVQKYLIDSKISYRLLGWGANQVLTQEDGYYLKLDFESVKIDKVEDEYSLPASTALNSLTAVAMKLGLKGWEVFTGIPGSLGGAVCMNAGTSLGEVGEIVRSVKILKKCGETQSINLTPNDFVYRNNKFLDPGDIVFEVTLTHNGIDEDIKKIIKEYMEYRKSTQPLTTKNCGSVFKNHTSGRKAGKTIDELGLKGFGSEKLHVSHKHGNFIEHNGGATTEEFVELVHKLNDEIERRIGIRFELEVKLN